VAINDSTSTPPAATIELRVEGAELAWADFVEAGTSLTVMLREVELSLTETTQSQVRAYHPRAVIVIGRSPDWDEAKVKALHGLNGRVHGVTVMTYDLLAQGERLLDILERAEPG
jgi:hypothetical protein